MARAICVTCGKSPFFPNNSEGMTFCNEACEKQYFVNKSYQIDDLARREIREVHQGKCPQCGGDGPVDLHPYFLIWSALVMSSMSTKSVLACRKCATKYQLKYAAICAAVGWWGLPWGILMTPVYIVRNIWKLARPVDPSVPSADLEFMLRCDLGSRMIETEHTPEEVVEDGAW